MSEKEIQEKFGAEDLPVRPTSETIEVDSNHIHYVYTDREKQTWPL